MCPIPDCQWISFRSTDSSHLDACVQQLKMHVQLVHGMAAPGPMTGSSGREEKMHQEYPAATKRRTVEKTVDDATANLCEARFYPMPLDNKALGWNIPTSIIPINMVVNMSHVGVDITNADTLHKCQDRILATKKLI